MRKLLHIATLTLAMLAPVGAQGRAPQEAPGGLARARALFKKVDLDGDNFVSATEAGRNRIPGKEFVAHDDDRDRRLSREEFTLFYRQLLIRAGRPVRADLDAEAARIASARKAREVRETGRVPVPPVPTSEKPVPTSEKVVRAGDPPPASPVEVKDPAPGAGGDARAQDEKAVEAERVAKARSDAQAVEAERISNARADQQRAVAGRTAKAREEQRRLAAGRSNPNRGTVREAPAKKSPEERAQAYVKRLVNAGRLTPAQARDYNDFLTAAPTGPLTGPRVTQLRAALRRAQGRIPTLVRDGGLSAQEGVQLSNVLDVRAGAILPPEEPDRSPEKSVGGDTAKRGEPGVGPRRGEGSRKNGGSRRDG